MITVKKQQVPRWFKATRGIENSEKRYDAGAVLGEKDLAHFSETSIKNWIARGVLVPARGGSSAHKPQEVSDGTAG